MGDSPIDEIPWADIAVIAAGAGGSDQVITQLQKLVPQVPADVAGAGAGLAMILWGDRVHRLVRVAGFGVIAGSLKERVGGWLAGVAPAAAPIGTGVPKTAASAAAQAYIAGRR